MFASEATEKKIEVDIEDRSGLAKEERVKETPKTEVGKESSIIIIIMLRVPAFAGVCLSRCLSHT